MAGSRNLGITKCDTILFVFEAIKKLLEPPVKEKVIEGFKVRK